MNKKQQLSMMCSGILCMVAVSAHGQSETQSEHIATVINAKPIERKEPRYPQDAARKGQEGWTRVSFVIDKEGNVVDPIIQDSSGIDSIDKSALRAVKEWKYSPAKQDGKTIEQCQTMVQMDFRLNAKPGVSRKFKSRYMKIARAISDDDLDTAQAELTELGASKLWNYTEGAYYWLLDANYAQRVKDTQRELNSVNKALGSNHETLDDKRYLYLLERQFALRVNDTQYADALDSYQTILQQAHSESVVERLQPYALKITKAIEGQEPLVRQAKIEQGGGFYHKLSRDSFSLVGATDQLDELQIRCDNKLSRFTIAGQSQWQIRRSWGQCTIFVTGTPATEFNVVELGHFVGKSDSIDKI